MSASPLDLLTRLAEAEVDFVVIGGFAVIAHGHIRTTRDLDITYSTEPANLDALGRVLVELDAPLLLVPPPGAPSYLELKRRAEVIDLDGHAIAIASLDDLMTMKRAVGRQRDLDDIEALEAIRRLRAESVSAETKFPARVRR